MLLISPNSAKLNVQCWKYHRPF